MRPDHLFLGTDADNMQDMVRKGRGGGGGSAPGEHHPSARLSDAQVREIRERYRRCGAKGFGAQLAREYCVSPATISLIVTGKTRLDAGGPVTLARVYTYRRRTRRAPKASVTRRSAPYPEYYVASAGSNGE